MKCNIVFAQSVLNENFETVLVNPTFTFFTKYVPTLFTFGVSITFSEFELLEGNDFGFTIINEETRDIIYATEMNQQVPPVQSPDSSLTVSSMLHNIEIKNESKNTLYVIFNDEIIAQSDFIVKKGE